MIVGLPGYTTLTAIAVLAVIVIELLWLRTGIFATAQYWLALLIIFGFQILVDGWLTKLRAPIVIYDDRQNLGVRWPWDIPVEDFGFGFAMVTLAILLWKRFTRPTAAGQDGGARTAADGRTGGRLEETGEQR